MHFFFRFLLFGNMLLCMLLPQQSNANENTLFKQYKAAPLEARVASFYQFGNDRLRLDIGNSFDISEFMLQDSSRMSIGTDFFTYTRLRSEGNFKFPVETTDFYFGVNGAWISKAQAGMEYGLRLRLAHISTHLVDGYADSAGNFSRQKPFVYSREFADLSGSVQFDYLRIYSGITWLWATQPRNVGRFIPQLGTDIRYPVQKGLEIQAGYDFRISSVNERWIPTHSVQAGLAWLNEKRRGIWLGLLMSAGRSLHGMFHTEQDTYIGTGFQALF
jgi:hypothetical protein